MRGQGEEKAMQNEELPTIRVAIGRKITEVAARSRLDFRLSSKNDNTAHSIEQPVVVVYDDPRFTFKLPATRFAWISQQAGVVTELTTSPQLELLPLEESCMLAKQLASLFTESGWHLSHRPSDNIDKIRAEVLNPERYWTYEHLFGEWRAEAVVLRLTLRESGKGIPKEAKPHPVFLVNVNIQDEGLKDEMQNLVYRTRQEINGNIDQPLPLSFYLARRQ